MQHERTRVIPAQIRRNISQQPRPSGKQSHSFQREGGVRRRLFLKGIRMLELFHLLANHPA